MDIDEIKEEIKKKRKIKDIIDEMKKIRFLVKDDIVKQNFYWSEYHRLQNELQELDPYNPELDIAISGLPFLGFRI